LPTLEGHEHATEFRPRDFATVDDKQRDAITIALHVTIDQAFHDGFSARRIRYLRTMFGVLDIFDGNAATNLFD